jgi:hypothetical protein
MVEEYMQRENNEKEVRGTVCLRREKKLHLLEGFHAVPARPSDKGSTKMKASGW